MDHRMKALDAVDATVFSSDALLSAEYREALKLSIDRWQRALDEHGDDGHGLGDGEPCPVCHSRDCNGECYGDDMMGSSG